MIMNNPAPHPGAPAPPVGSAGAAWLPGGCPAAPASPTRCQQRSQPDSLSLPLRAAGLLFSLLKETEAAQGEPHQLPWGCQRETQGPPGGDASQDPQLLGKAAPGQRRGPRGAASPPPPPMSQSCWGSQDRDHSAA